MKKKPTLSKLKKKLDQVFSIYIRQRDKGKGCITCKRSYDVMQAGHFVSRSYHSVRWDERNVNSQCYGCNVGKRGAMDEYWIAMEEKYGRPVIDELITLKRQSKKLQVSDLQEMIEDFKNKLTPDL